MLFPAHETLLCRIGWLVNKDSGEAMQLGCQRWGCSKCGPLRVRRWRRRIAAWKPEHKRLKLLTITLPGGLDRVDKETIRYMAKCWRMLKQAINRQCKRRGTAGILCYAWVREVGTQGRQRLHQHIIIDMPYMAQRQLSRIADRVGLGRVLDIRAVKHSVKGAATYVSKYLTKAYAGALPRFARRIQTNVPHLPRGNGDWEFQDNWKFHRPDLLDLHDARFRLADDDDPRGSADCEQPASCVEPLGELACKFRDALSQFLVRLSSEGEDHGAEPESG